MRGLCAAIFLTSLCSSASWAQRTAPVQPMRDDAVLKEALVAKVNGFLLAWENHDAAALTAALAPDFLYVSSQGVAPREGVVAALTHTCTLSSYSLSDVQLVKISPESAALVYKIHQSSSCAGHPDPPMVLNTDTLVRRGGKWVFLLTTSTSVQ